MAKMPTASPNSTSAVTIATGLRSKAPPPVTCSTSVARTLLTGIPSDKGSDRSVRHAKNHSAVRRESTKKRREALTFKTETCTTPAGYCAVVEPGVPWCHKGFHYWGKPRITLRVGKLTIGDGS
ncbi:hypothetical protein GCM10010298_53980 [Streptomyces microflavus]|uniref:Uncharacterized protein n=1 Tax=Streptomyces microflavus TaxID=1919 RepID=A0A7J0CW75_STRMI|nr:hypothetical protein Smic_52140 [Streptomyces microflavus]GGX81737.1 hypothetical protein GCM10010298_53980 [Streptomyces microflavus]